MRRVLWTVVAALALAPFADAQEPAAGAPAAAPARSVTWNGLPDVLSVAWQYSWISGVSAPKAAQPPASSGSL
jgi:hypothetical protein